MSTLRSALDELRAEDLCSLSDDVLVGHLDEIERAGRVLEAERCRGLAELERRRVYAADGHLSAASWLAHRQGLSRRSAEAAVRRARALDAMPSVARAFGEGDVSESAVHVLARAQDAAPEAFVRSEDALVEAASTMAYGELRRVSETWRIAADPERSLEGEDRRHELRRLDIRPDDDGMTRVEGELDAEDGQALITAIRAQLDAETRSAIGPDTRTPAQRRADALGEIGRRWLASRDRPTVGGERPHDVVTIDLEALVAGSGRSDLEDTGAITAESARRLACDAEVTRVITRGASQPLELGRRTKVVPGGAQARGRRPRPRLSLPRLRPSTRMVRRASCGALGRRRRDIALESRPALPPAPQGDPPRLRRADDRRRPRVHASRRFRDRRSSAAADVERRLRGSAIGRASRGRSGAR